MTSHGYTLAELPTLDTPDLSPTVRHWLEVIGVAERGMCASFTQEFKERVARAAARIANGKPKRRGASFIKPHDRAVQFIARQLEQQVATVH